MAKDRNSLHTILLGIVPNVYFQPPPTQQIKYPAIIYKLDDISSKRANGKRYLSDKRYLVTVVDRDPDTTFYEKVLDLPYSKLETVFTKDNLNQYVCSLYW